VPYDPEARHEVQIREVEYLRRGDMSLIATVYRPRGGDLHPALLDVHGGAWSSGSRSGSAAFHERLASTGLVVVAVDFRLAPQFPYPAQVADVNYATRWLKANAAGLGADTSRLGAIGSSSGGHTLMLSAMRPDDPRYRDPALPAASHSAEVSYAVLRWPVLDSYARYRYAREREAAAASSGPPPDRDRLALATEGYFRSEEAMQEGSPTLILERGEPARLPPALIVQGTADGNIPMSIPDAFVASYRDRGGHVEIELFEGMPHAFMAQPGPETARAFACITRFIARQLNGGEASEAAPRALSAPEGGG
jgi:acetyl esterase/lipase